MNAAAAGGEAASGAAAAGGVTAANAAGAAVQAGIEGGKAVAEIAAGTAAGGPWGAVIAAAWAMRHTLFKVLIAVCLFLLFIIIMVVSLPSIIFNSIFHTDPSTVDPSTPTEMFAAYEEMATVVSDCVTAGYNEAKAEVERIISDGGYDYDLSMEALIDNGHVSVDYDVCYILAAYSGPVPEQVPRK